MSPAVIMARPSPHKLLLMVVQVIVGVAYTLGVPAPTSVAATQPVTVIHLWALAMLISGTVGLGSNLWRRRDLGRALSLEAGAMLLGAAAMVLYSASLLAYAGSRAFMSALICAAWAAANLWRTLQIRRDLREVTP